MKALIKSLGIACLCLACFVTPAAPAKTTPISKAYSYLYSMMDAYSQGGTLRLVRSYTSTPTFSTGSTAFTYDNDLVITALLARATPEDVQRAMVLGDALIYVQTHDGINDGRVRNAYEAKQLAKDNGRANVATAQSDSYTGNMAWTGIAFIQLYRVTKEPRFLAAAKAIGTYIETSAKDSRGAGGFSGGVLADQSKIMWKSTEHNIDAYAFFTLMRSATKEAHWKKDAQSALAFLRTMWNPQAGNFYIGTGLDGVTVNKGDPTPEDVQTWSYLSLALPEYQSSIDWALTHLTATSGAFQGLSFDVADRSGVWYEGTGHAAAALAFRGQTGDDTAYAALIQDIEVGQVSAPNANGSGIDAASKDGLKAGGDVYNAAPHIGATAWYCMAKRRANPYRSLRH
ncbi:MAG TPA: hypothetical protein VHL34_18640 [Rhizomicrobium sp.]|jgi:hypothetical protein|nr:hypothetical protein [Rhizomicrobium sp.]